MAGVGVQLYEKVNSLHVESARHELTYLVGFGDKRSRMDAGASVYQGPEDHCFGDTEVEEVGPCIADWLRINSQRGKDW